MTYQEFKAAIIAEAAANNIAEYELYYESGSDTSVDVFLHEINGFSSSESGGVCFRCIVDGRMGYASTQALSAEEAKNIVRCAAENAASLETDEAVFLCEGGKEYETVAEESYTLPGVDTLIHAALDAQEKLYAADSAVIDGTQSQAVIEHSEIAIYNSKGLDLHWSGDAAGIVLSALVTDGTEVADSYKVKLGRLEDIDVDELVEKVVENAKLKLGGETPATGSYPIVFSPDAMASLLSTFAAVFSSENTQKGLSRLAGMEGEKIASDCVTLVDDPFHPESRVRRSFDGEGCPTHTKNVIEAGTLNTLLYNMKTAAAAGRETTGNARKAGYDGSINVGPFTMYIAAGELTEEELFTKAEGGILITSLQGLHAGANAVSGDFSLQSTGFMLKGGKKADYVKSFTVAGNFYDMLKNVTALSDTVTIPSPIGATTFGSPYVLCEGLSVGGK